MVLGCQYLNRCHCLDTRIALCYRRNLSCCFSSHINPVATWRFLGVAFSGKCVLSIRCNSTRRCGTSPKKAFELSTGKKRSCPKQSTRDCYVRKYAFNPSYG